MTMQEFIDELGLTMACQSATANPYMTDPKLKANHYRVTIFNAEGDRFSTYFSMGLAHKKMPDLEGVLECLRSDCSSADQPFKEWATDLGYDTGSRKAYKTWEVVLRQARELKRLFGTHYQTFLEVEEED